MKKHWSNKDIANILFEMAALYEMEGVPFKPRAYENAAHAIEALPEDLTDVFKKGGEEAIRSISGIGKGIAGHIEDLLTKGQFKEYERMKKRIPVDMLELTSIEGVGARTVATLWKKLKIKNMDDLERAGKKGLLAKLAGFGKRSEEKILKGIEFRRASGKRLPLGATFSDITRLEQSIRRFPEVDRVAVAGSVRRWKETIGDIDILAVSNEPEKVMQRFVKLPIVAAVFGTGPTKTNVRLKTGIDADLRVVPEASWGAALNYFTGSKAHNIALRTIAIKKGYKLNEYGLYEGRRMIAGKTEKELYESLGLSYIEPELRELTGEVEAAQKGKLPKLIGYGDLRGDLQVQTSWTDGKASIEAMADAAEHAGLAYIAITDHTKALPMTGGLDEKGLAKQGAEIDAINKKRKTAGKKLVILKGAEVNILKDGSLDVADDALAKLDVVGAAIHSHFTLSRAQQTERLIAACENPHVDIIFHPSTRLKNKRNPIDFDIDELIRTAKRTGTILEIDAFPDRLDLKDEYVRKCVEAGVLMSIDSDAHATEHFSVLKFGIAQARRGWAQKRDIVNTLPLAKLLAKLKRPSKS